jgi:hypothetical protein
VDCLTSPGFCDDSCVRLQRDLFLAALELSVQQQQLANHPHAIKQSKRMKVRIRSSVQQKTQPRLAPSRQRLIAARKAWQEHVQPQRGGYNVCDPGSIKTCIVEPGSVACAAGGKCQQLRAALKWPDNLPLVDPNRASVNGTWVSGFSAWLEDSGLGSIPKAATANAPSPPRYGDRWSAGMCAVHVLSHDCCWAMGSFLSLAVLAAPARLL